MNEHEPDKPEEWCCTCRFNDWDSWYPEKVCYCRQSEYYDLPTDETGSCPYWEWDEENAKGET